MKMHWFPFVAIALILVSAGIRLFLEKGMLIRKKERNISIALVVLGILVFTVTCLWLR